MDLSEAFTIGDREVIALVGGGGKTTTMYRLAAEAAGRGQRAVASGTARFTLPFGGTKAPLILEEDESRLRDAVVTELRRTPWVIASTRHGSKRRLEPISDGLVAELAAEPAISLIALEADGSAMRAFKAPLDHEPAIPPSATLVIAVVGADVLGRPLTSEFVHRPERVMALTGAQEGEPVTPEAVATVLSHPEGGRRRIPPGARFAVLINKVSNARLAPAQKAAGLLLEAGVPLVVLGQVREAEPVVMSLTTSSPHSLH